MSATPAKLSAESRRVLRRSPKPGTTVECRKGTLGLGPDIAVKLHDFSEDGVLLTLREEAAPGDEIELSLTPPGFSRPTLLEAVVARCTFKEGEGYQVAAAFRMPLSYAELFHLT